jgi:hypothetical protein
VVSNAGVNGISVTNGGQSVVGAMLPGKQYYAEVLSGAYEGHRFEINESSSSAGTLTIALGGRTTLSSVPPDLTGARIAVREHCIISDVLPARIFLGTGNPSTADRLMFWNGSGYDTLWNVQTATLDRWVTSSDATLADLGQRVLAPCEGLFVHPRNGNVSAVITGIVRTNKLCCPLQAGSSFLGSGWPADLSPSQLGASTITGFTGSAAARNADQIRTWLGDTTFGAEGYNNSFLLKAGSLNQWTLEGSATLQNQNDTKLLRSTHAVFMLMRSPNPSFCEPLPWIP